MWFKKIFCLLFAITIVFSLTACEKYKPYIGENGNWYVDEEDLGVAAQGPKGEDGTSITVVSVEKTDTNNNVDTYTITFSNGTVTTFTVTNGVDGAAGSNGEDLTISSVEKTKTEGLVDTYTIYFSNDSTTSFTITNGKDGKVVTILNIEKTASQELIDTYTVTYTDGNTFSFTVVNGKTPYIGENGNWWIGNEDTGVFADYSKLNTTPLTSYSDGLEYTPMTINGINGYAVSGYDSNISSREGEKHLVIPNYFCNFPVIGILSDVNFPDVDKITLSNNIIYLAKSAFRYANELKEIDFNNCPITYVSEGCFNDCVYLSKVTLSDTITKLENKAFVDSPITDINLENITYYGAGSLSSSVLRYLYLDSSVEYVGSYAFSDTFVYVEHDEIPTSWYSSIKSGELPVIPGAKKNDLYIYSIKNSEVTVYQYLGNEKKLIIPASIESIPVTTVGAGFNSRLISGRDIESLSQNEAIEFIRNNEGYLDEVVVSNNVKRINFFAFMNCNMFLYISKNVEEVYASSGDWLLTTSYYNWSPSFLDDDWGFGFIVVEDPTKTKLIDNKNGNEMTYDDKEVLIKTNIKYDDIYYDDENDIYYVKNNLSWEVLACRAWYADVAHILDNIDNIPVKTIGKFAFYGDGPRIITIGSNINKIKSYAFYETNGIILIPKNVSIINANGLDVYSEAIVLVEVESKPDDWDSNWISSSYAKVYYSVPVDNLAISGNFLGTIKNDGTVELIMYTGAYSSQLTLKIPRVIDNRIVSSIKNGFYAQKTSYPGVKIYIPSTISAIEYDAFDFYYSSTSYYPTFYVEVSEIPETYANNWYYNSYRSSNKYFYCYTAQDFDY